jgi:hypothetical protein
MSSIRSSVLSSVDRVAAYNLGDYPNVITVFQLLEFVDATVAAYNAVGLDVCDLPTTRSVESINKAVIDLMNLDVFCSYDDEWFMDKLGAIVNLAMSIANCLDESDYADDLADRFNAFQVRAEEF